MSNKRDYFNDFKKDRVDVIDEKNGVKCEYNNDSNRVICYVLEDEGLDETVVSHVIENFWDSQPEYYRGDYNILL